MSVDTARWSQGPGDRRPRYRYYKLTYDSLGTVLEYNIFTSLGVGGIWGLKGEKREGRI